MTTLSPLLQSALVAIRRTTGGMTDKQLFWHPQGKWSSIEILEHLSLAYSRTTDRMKALVQHELPEIRKGTIKQRMGQVLVLRFRFIPPGQKAPEVLLPKGMKPAEAASWIEEKLSELDKSIDQCEERFGSEENILAHHALGPLSASEWRKFHWVHTLHHMKQIRKNRELAVIG